MNAMSEWPLTEWQPVRLKKVHGAELTSNAKELLSRVVRVRKWPDGKHPEMSCPGEKWFQIHPDDCLGARGIVLVCEHEILAD